MKIRQKTSLYTTIILCCIFTIVFTTTLIISKNIAINDAFSNLESIAKAQENQLNNLNNVNLERLLLVSRHSNLCRLVAQYNAKPQEALKKDINNILYNTLESVPDFISIQISNTQGIIIASTEQRDTGNINHDKYCLPKGIQKPVTNHFFIENDSSLVMHLSGPLFYENRSAGVLTIKIKGSKLQKILTDYSLVGKTGYNLLVIKTDEPDKFIITTRRSEKGGISSRIVHYTEMGEVSRKTAEMKTGTYENLTDYKGEPVSAIIGYCKALDVGYSVRMNRDEIYTPVVLFRNTLLVVAVITLCLAVALTYFAIKRFTQPLITLTNHTAEVTKGNLDQRIQLNSNDEIGILGEAFNNMTVKLREDIRNREKSEKMLAHILHGLPIATIVIDKNKKVTHWNSACESLTGIPAEEIVGTDHQWKAFYSTERAILANLMLYKNPKPLLERFYKGKFYKSNKIKDAWMAEDYFPNLGKDGKWLFFTAAPIYDIDGTIIGALEAFQDITKRKRAEEDRQKALEKAIESEKLKTAFLANMSHEIRTPMNGIMGFIDLLNNPDISTSDTQNYTNIIKKNGARLLNTINDIIDISKIESGQMTVVKAETSVNELLEELYEFFLPETKQKNLKLRCEYALPNNMAIISTDNNKLHAILRNLIKNAIKYTRKGSINFGYSEKGNFLEFYIHDTGMGIPKERIQAVFNRFEQADIEDKGSFEGSGLGLAISKAYVEMLGGTIHVESKTENREKEIPGWSKFNFTIPYNAISANAIKNHTNNENKTIIPKIKNSRISILIIEDDTSSALLLESMLNDYYSNIISLSGGLEAVTYLKENNPADVVLMDIKMAKMNGYEATKEIRKFNDKITIIAQTAYAMEGDRKKAIEAGCNDYITKPIDKNKLLDIIDQHINNKSTD